MPALDLRTVPKEVRDIIEIRESQDPTFGRFVDEDYSDIFWSKLMERADPNNQHSILCSVTGLQGCFSGETKITTRNGMKKIEEINDKDEVWSGGTWRSCIPIYRGTQKTMMIELRNGVLLRMTPDHVMNTTRGWVAAKDIVEGDTMISGNVPWSDVWNEDSERAAVIAMLLADGHLDVLVKKEKYDYVRVSDYKMSREPKKYYEWVAKRVRFYRKDASVRKKMSDWLKKHYCATATGSYDDVFKGEFRTKVMCIQNAEVFDAVVKAGAMVGNKSSKVVIPEWVLRSDAAMNGFLAGYFACDGSFYGTSIEISSCSEELIRSMQVWLLSRGVVSTVRMKKCSNKNKHNQWRLFLRQADSLNKWVECVPNLSDTKRAVKKTNSTKQWVKYTDAQIARWWRWRKEGMTFNEISSKVGVAYSVLWLAMNKKGRGIRNEKNTSGKRHLLTVTSIRKGSIGNVFDLHVREVHEYLANGLVSQNSGKSLSSISMCCFLDPGFNVDQIFFGYENLVNNRHLLRQNCAVLVDEQSQLFGLDSHRVNVVLQNLKETLRKKSIHFFMCSPTLYAESATSMYIIETMFIDFETREVVAALKTREGLTLGHIRIPHPLKVLEDGSTLATQKLIDEYEKKKDEYLERVLGQKNVDQYELWAQGVLDDPLFKRLEKIYIRKMGYIPSGTLIQIVNKLRPEFNNGVVPVEIAGRIKLNRELAGLWDVSGRSSRRKEK